MYSQNQNWFCGFGKPQHFLWEIRFGFFALQMIELSCICQIICPAMWPLNEQQLKIALNN